MNYIYDVVLNFFDLNNCFEFYEWDKNDKFIYIEKIPIYRINSLQMEELINNKVKFNSKFLTSIYNKTKVNNDRILYCFLITDSSKVMALKLDSDGVLIEKSNLLLDEEDAVIDESNDFELELLDYEMIDKINNNYLLTRREKSIQKYLLDEISNLYNNKEYDEIEYLYNELYYDSCSIYNKYRKLISDIKNNFDSNKGNTLYDIIKLTKKKINIC